MSYNMKTNSSVYVRVVVIVLFSLVIFFAPSSLYAQNIKWFNPQHTDTLCIQQRAWAEEMQNSYDRVPSRMNGILRSSVYNLSHNSAGLAIHFYTNSPTIRVRYKVTWNLSMPHMPTTGVSGIDLYNISKMGQWTYLSGKYSFGSWVDGEVTDGIKQASGVQCEYNFNELCTSSESEYRLYLPLYNVVSEMEIGVEEGSIFKIAPVRKEKPIVAYGSSVTQGACASRPGNAWTNMLSRQLDWPIVNLGFSGCGLLDPEFIDLINEIDAAVFILDCNGNLIRFPREKIIDLTLDAVRKLRASHPNTPILIADFPGFKFAQNGYASNSATLEAYNQLCKDDSLLYYLSCKEQAEPSDGKVDGIHPNDLGMYFIANAYEAKLREILHMPVGQLKTQIPVSQRRDIAFYDWMDRHEQTLATNQSQSPRNVIMGDSITHYWGGFAKKESGRESWYKYFVKAGYENLGCGWDYVENLLWRVYHGELDGFDADNIIVNIGTNNLFKDSDEDIANGILFLLDEIRYRQPQARIKFIGILPRNGREERVATLNKLIKEVISAKNYEFCDCGDLLLAKNGKIEQSLFIDGLHPNEKGYKRIARKILK